MVVKFGGSIMENEAGVRNILGTLPMECVGMHPVVVHGGGKATKALRDAGIQSEFIQDYG